MQYKNLGQTDIKVSELCFGALPMGPLQANMTGEDGGNLIKMALEEGVNFIDTAEMYQTYPHIAHGIKEFKGEVIIASKSTARDYKGMEKAVQDALKSLNREVIDIFHLHAARATPEVFKERSEAIRCLLDYKEKGYVRAIGISTHNVEVVEKAAEIEEIDIVYPIINKIGRGILNGSVEDMLKAIEKCSREGKGLYAMKVLAGGNLIHELQTAVAFARNIAGMDSVSIGMIKAEELDLNIKIFNDEVIPDHLLPKAINSKKLFLLDKFCKKCGACVKACPNYALSMGEESVKVDHSKCLLCGYCYPVCPEFVIRML